MRHDGYADLAWAASNRPHRMGRAHFDAGALLEAQPRALEEKAVLLASQPKDAWTAKRMSGFFNFPEGFEIEHALPTVARLAGRYTIHESVRSSMSACYKVIG